MYSYYLSYGHAPRLRPEDRPDIDHWAGILYTALNAVPGTDACNARELDD